MNITVDERRIEKMQQRLGKATKLISDDRYLPMFRNRQLNYTKEFDFSVKLSKKKRDPRRYFASIWSSRNLAKTVDWLRKLMNLAKHETAARRQQQKMEDQMSLRLDIDGLEQLRTLKCQYNLIT